VGDVSKQPANIDGTVVELTVEHGPNAAAEALRRIDTAKIVLTGLTLREPSLDDVFLNLTGHKAEDPPSNDNDAPSSKRRSRKESV
jgi:ABC-2 type transport system ATP-binding protein